MSFHGVIVCTITIAGVFIQVEFQSKGSSLLDTHYWIMSIFFVAFLVFAAEWLMKSRTTDGDNVNHAGAMSEISLLSGILAFALLFLILHVVIGLELSWIPRKSQAMPSTEVERKPLVLLFVMSFHKAIGFTINILGVFIQWDFQTKSSSLMEPHYWTMSIFLVALLAFAVTWLMSTSQVQAENSSHTKALNQISLVSGIIAVSLLFLIIHAVIGCVILISLALYLIKSIYSYKPVHDALFLLIAKVKRAIRGQSDEENEETTPRATGG